MSGISGTGGDPVGRALLALAGLSGAAGVATAAAGAHLGGANLPTVALMLLVHAPAFLGLGLAGPGRPRGLAAAGLVVATGLALFALDLVWRDAFGRAALPAMAPTGGLVMIGGWLALAVLGAIRRQRP